MRSVHGTRTFSVRRQRRAMARSGFTLIEILIATTVTMMMMAALAVGFKRLGDGITEGRAKLNLSDRLRSVTAILRNDIEGLTLKPDPTGSLQGVGYFQYYEGPVHDYSLQRVDPASNRFGDHDDVLMFTARAGADWFRGKVPLAILKMSQSPAYIPTVQDWFDRVVIASEYAEIVYFVEPRIDFESPNRLDLVPSDGSVPMLSLSTAIPEELTLHRRVLLIRPDLNLSSSAFPGGRGIPVTCASSINFFEMVAAQEPNTPCGNTIGMRFAHTNCDLSLRRLPGSTAVDPAGNVCDHVAANSLNDLSNPENRFGHFQIALPIGSDQVSTTMPVLALTNPLAYATNSVSIANAGIQCGFIHPMMSLGDYQWITGLPSGFAPYFSRYGQDMLSANVLGFDVRGFDPGVALLPDAGPNGVLDGVAAGSDDLVLSPNDPGYGDALFDSTTRLSVMTGAFVDLNWAAHLLTERTWSIMPSGVDQRIFTPLSGFSAANSLPPRDIWSFTTELYKSGKILHPDTSNGVLTPVVYQPTFDTWTTAYESDAKAQKPIQGFLGNIWYNRQNDYGASGDDLASGNFVNSLYRSFTQIDSGADGLDNDLANGPDDAVEQETSPPYAIAMPAVQISVRIEDKGTRLVQQMSVVHDFVSQ